MENRAEDILSGFDSLKSQRSKVDTVYRDIERLVLPNYQGSDRKSDSYEGQNKRPESNIATEAAIMLGANLYSYTFSTTDRNFVLRTNEPSSKEKTKEWLQQASDIASRFLQTSNLTSVYGEFCQSLTTFGTAVASVEYDTDRGELIFKHHPITGEVYIIEGIDGRVDGIMRKLQLSSRQALQMFGHDGLCDEAKNALSDLSLVNQKYDYILSVQSNPDYKKDSINIKNAKYVSEYVCVQDKRIVKKSGYKTFPYIVARWIKSYDGSPYGIGSGAVALPAVRKINESEFQLHDAFAIQARPPVFVNDDGVTEIEEIKPNSVVYTDLSQAQPFQLQIHAKPEVIMERIRQLTEQISKSFFNHVFLSLTSMNGGSKTATEIEAVQSEKLHSLTPLVANLRSEFWQTMVERVIYLLMDNQVIEAPEQDLQGIKYRIEYVSQLDARLDLISAQKTMMALQGAAQILMIGQQTVNLDKVFKTELAAKRHLEASNVDYELLVSEVERQRIAEQEQEAAQAEQEQLQQQQVLEKMGKIDPNKEPENGSLADAVGTNLL